MSTQPKNIHLAEPLLAQLEAAARAKDTTPDELVSEAVEKFLRRGRLQQLQSYGERRAQELGIGLEDVDRLIHEHRQEQRSR